MLSDVIMSSSTILEKTAVATDHIHFYLKALFCSKVYYIQAAENSTIMMLIEKKYKNFKLNCRWTRG